MSEFKSNKKELDAELERFIALLSQILPIYHELLQKKKLSDVEVKKLSELENYLVGVNAKILDIKKKLEQDLFGKSLNSYYKLKEEARGGNPYAKLKLEKMRDTFAKALKAGEIINFN